MWKTNVYGRVFWSVCAALVAGAVSNSGSLLAQQPYRVIDHWKIGGDSSWDYLHIDPVTQRLYVSHGKSVAVLDAKTGKLIGSVEGLSGCHGIVIDATGKFGYISDGSGGIVIFDTKTLAKVKTIPTEFSADGIEYEPLTKTVWTFNGRPGNANTTAVDTTTQELVATIPVPNGRLEAETADGNGHVFGNIGGDIARIDAKAKEIDAQWTTGCSGASGLAFDRKGNRIFQACNGRKLYIVDATDGKVLGTAEIGDGPDGAGFSEKHDLAFVPTRDGFLTVVDASAPGFPVVEKLRTQNGARTMDYDPTKDRIYTASADADPNFKMPAMPAGGPGAGGPGGPGAGGPGGPGGPGASAGPGGPNGPGGPAVAGPGGSGGQNRPSPYLPDTFQVIVIGR